MDVFFINLADQAERREYVESTFQAHNALGWRLHRIAAVTAQAVKDRGVPGPIRDAEKGCFLSHIDAITESKKFDGHAFIAEDDIQFGKQSFQAIEAILETVPDDAWDIVYTDILFPDLHTMIDGFLQRRRDGSKQTLINLREARFAGSTAYIVNRNAKDRVLNLISQGDPIDRPYDLYLQRLIRNDLLRAFLVFPFATTVSALGEDSQIQTSDNQSAEFIWSSFRRLMWAERDIGAAGQAADRIFAAVKDDETEAFSRMLAGMLAPGFKRKSV
jgi:GR25 family glycosyltransferase involved in LPS biosynthesis